MVSSFRAGTRFTIDTIIKMKGELWENPKAKTSAVAGKFSVPIGTEITVRGVAVIDCCHMELSPSISKP